MFEISEYICTTLSVILQHIKPICCLILILLGSYLHAQNVDIESVTKSTAVKINGGISANSVFYNANQRSSREPFTYFLQGNLNISWLTFSMPLSYSFTNQGSSLDYQVPFNFNRLSLYPKYKWIQGYLGDVAMTFSPYTLNGHQFTGAGVDLTPKGAFSISLMGGRLLKSVEDDGNIQTLPAYRRMGYGTKLEYKKENYKLGVIGFYAKDDVNSLNTVLDNRDINPKENLVASLLGEITLAENVTLNAEYSSTAISQDTRASGNDTHKGLSGVLFNGNGSTQYFDAIKTGINFKVAQMQLGANYERIDPGYQTLGAYYFNNDFENITINGSRPFFNNKVNLSFNFGYQRDNLENQKQQATSRFVGSVNGNWKVSDKLTLTASYSNFSTYTNQDLNQFDNINDDDLTDEELEALDYKQLSQNANINVNWVFAQGESTNQNLNLNYSLASSANEQAGVIRVGQANNFHNSSASYTIGFPKKDLNITTSVNFTYADIGREDATTYGGSINVSKQFFKQKLKTSFGTTYNTSENQTSTTDVLNFNLSTSTTVANKHNFSLNAIQLFRNSTDQESLNELTVTFGYAYSFDLGKPKKK